MLRQSAKRLLLATDEAVLERLASGKLASSSAASAGIGGGGLGTGAVMSAEGLLMSAMNLRLSLGLLVRRGLHTAAHQGKGPSLPLRPGLFSAVQVGVEA